MSYRWSGQAVALNPPKPPRVLIEEVALDLDFISMTRKPTAYSSKPSNALGRKMFMPSYNSDYASPTVLASIIV